MRKNKKRFKRSKSPRRKNFIYKGDLCFFKRGTECYMPDENGKYNSNITRTIWPGEHVIYLKRFRDEEDRSWKFLIEIYGRRYVHFGTIKDLTKKHIKYQQTYEDVSGE